MTTCPDCEEPMTAELLRPDPHEPPVYMLICPCGYWTAADIEADLENRPRMPGF